MNKNCLEGVRCPKCDNENQFIVSAVSRCFITDDGIETTENAEWSDDSPFECSECGYANKVNAFKKVQP